MPVVIARWDQLSDLDRERLIIMWPYLDELFAGVELFSPLLPKDTRLNRPAHRFFRNAVFQYLDAFYTEGNNGILPVLDSIGQDDLADLIRKELKEPVGNSTVGEILRTWRNRSIAHLTFRLSHIVDPMDEAGMTDRETAELFMTHIQFLIEITRTTRDLVRDAYPQTLIIDRRRDEPTHA